MISTFAFAMLLGIIVGSYWSLFITTPVLLWLEARFGRH